MCAVIFRGKASNRIRVWHDNNVLANFHAKSSASISHVRRNEDGEVEFEPSLFDRIFEFMAPANGVDFIKEHQYEL